MSSYGMMFKTTSGLKILITGDTQYDSSLEHFYKEAHVIFHDCETYSSSQVHIHYSKLMTFPDSYKAKMWLYGYNDEKLHDATLDGFLGFVKTGQVFDYG